MNKLSNFNKGFLSAFGMAFCFSMIGILGVLVYQGGASPITLLIGRAFIGTILFFLTVFFLKKKSFKIERKDVVRLLIHSSVLVVHLVLCWNAINIIRHIPTVYAIHFTYPIWIFIMAALFLKEKINKKKIASLSLGIIGVLFVIQFLPAISLVGISLIGVGLMLLASLFWAIYLLYGQVLLEKYNLFTILFYNFLVCFIAFFLMQGISTTISELTIPVIKYIVLMGVITTYLAYLLYYFAIKKIGVVNTSIINLVVPFLGAVLAFLVLKQTITLFQLLGITLITSGVYLLYKKYD